MQLARGFSIHCDKVLVPSWQGDEVYGEDYARALSGAKVGLGFLRKVCPDQHTTRTFEIPACGSLLLAEPDRRASEILTEGKEAEFFASTEELLDKVKFYCGNESARRRIAQGGHKHCIDGKYAYVHRLKIALTAMSSKLSPEQLYQLPLYSRRVLGLVRAALSHSPGQVKGNQLILASRCR